jgi:hypothetical protein
MDDDVEYRRTVTEFLGAECSRELSGFNIPSFGRGFDSRTLGTLAVPSGTTHNPFRDNFGLAEYSGVDAIFVNTSASVPIRRH